LKRSIYRKELSAMSAAIKLRLSRAERRRFVREAKKTKDVKYSQRMHALLGLALGLAVGVVASQACVRRQTIWLWVKLYLANRNERDLRPYESPGRPRKTTIDQDFQIVEAVESDPQEEGYAATCWTASLLRTHLGKSGITISTRTLRRRLHEFGYRYKRPKYVIVVKDPDWKRKKTNLKRNIRRIIKRNPDALILFEDETTLRMFPPLRAAWMKIGQQKKVPLPKSNARRVLFGVLDYRTGEIFLFVRPTNGKDDFCAFLDHIKERFSEEEIYLILDNWISHTQSEDHANILDINLLWLPKGCPELNPCEDLWGHLKDNIAANRTYKTIQELVERSQRWLYDLTPQEIKTKAAIMSKSFWLST
jgi:transposase